MRTSTLIWIIIVIIVLAIGLYWYSNTSPAPGTTGAPTSTTATSTATNTARVLFPLSGDELQQGEAYSLRWQGTSTSATSTHIFLIDTSLESQGASVAISDRVYNVPDTGSYRYTVPSSTPAGMYRFEIGALTSAPFQISSSTAQ